MKNLITLIAFFAAVITAQAQEDVFDTARHGSVEQMKQLEKINKDTINTISPMGFSPLILACYRGNDAVARYLAPKVKDINYASDSGTALAAVAVKGNTALAKVLLENHADPNIADPLGVTPLVYAVQFENMELIKLLLQYKADKMHADKSGKTPADHANFTKNQEIINLFKS